MAESTTANLFKGLSTLISEGWGKREGMLMELESAVGVVDLRTVLWTDGLMHGKPCPIVNLRSVL